MSVEHMQEALALLIRLPDHHRSESGLQAFLDRFDLDDVERQNLTALAYEREILKFGKKMRQGRIVYLQESLEVSCRLLDDDEVTDLIKTEFEPAYTTNDIRDIYGVFRDFLLHESKQWSQICARSPAYLSDVASFELTEAEAEFTGLRPIADAAACRYLVHTQLRLLKCSYQVDEFVERARDLQEDVPLDFSPEKITSYYLFVRDTDHELGFRQFAIDATLYDFITADLIEKPLEALPQAYSTLVDLGLFVPQAEVLSLSAAC